MSPIFDNKPKRFVQHRPAITEEPCCFRERADDIDNCNRSRSLLNQSQLAQSLVAQLLEKLILELARTFVRPKDFCLHLL